MKRAVWIALSLALTLLAHPVESRVGNRRTRPGYLDLRCATDGASVHVDGTTVGMVPLRDTVTLKPGEHTLKLSKEGFTQYFDVFVIKAGKVTSVEVDLLPVAGVFQVRANSDQARVFVDGAYVGTAPLETEVLAGSRTIIVRKAGYHDAVIKRNAVAGQRSLIEVNLKLMAIGTTPYRPVQTTPRWYEKWYIWAGAAGGVTAITLAIVVPVLVANRDPLKGYPYRFSVPGP